MSGNGPADPSAPKGPKKTGVGLQVKLPCATLDEVRARHPELSSRLFLLRTANPRPVATAIRLTATLSDGKHCFRANAVVEKVVQPGEPADRGGPGMSLWLARMDDPGRELIAWMGGQPPPLLKPAAADDSGGAAPVAPGSTKPPVQPVPPSDKVGEPASAGAEAAKKPAPAKTAPPPDPAAEKPAPTAAASSAGKPAAAARSIAPPATPGAKGTPAASKHTIIEEDFDVALEELEPLPAAPIPAAPPASIPAASPAPIPAASPAPSPAGSAAEVRSRAPATSQPGESKRPAPPPLPRPTLAPGAAPSPAPGQPDGEGDELPQARTGSPTGPVIGIDLGTTNSCAAVVKDGKPFVIPSREGYNTIPSVVALSDKGKLMVGHPAKSQLLINPRNTVYGAKRLIGRQFKSPAVTDLLGRFSYEVVAGSRGEAAVSMGGQIFSLQKISSLVLAEVKELAERWLGTGISRAVITVPAYYNDNQRQAVRAAGALAGLDVERIVNEPTAAAIAFAQGRALEQRVMVYDLGGGTFDTSVLELHGNVYEVISTGGDTFLGGVDFDKALVQDLLARFKQKHGISFEGDRFEADRVALQRINDAAERAKIALSERLTAQVSVPFVAMVADKGYNLDAVVSRAELEKLTADLIERTVRVCDDVLTNCGLKPADIGEVLLVGGQSRMPLVRARLREFFGKEPSKAVHPDEAVALGAAVLAHSMQSGDIGGMVLVDVLPMSIGVGLPGGRFKKVIERNTSLPHKKTYSIWTSQDDQKILEIPIFQGEAERAQQNEYLGTLIVPDLPPGTKGNVVFDIIFTVSPESILTVTAEERGTRRTVSATFSTQDTAETVKRRMAGGLGAEPERLDAPDPRGGKSGWMSRLFGRRVS
ncbi:MAG TPA: Hsp70 family protein [Myxococcales bacterium]